MRDYDSSDEELLRGYSLGKAACFEVFFSRHRERVEAYVRRKGIPPNEVSEIMQEAFLKLHKCITDYDESKFALPWFFTIVHHVCIDRLRKETRPLRHQIPFFPAAVEPQFMELHSEDDQLLECDFATTALKSLNDEQKNLLAMRFVKEMSFRQISQETGRTEVSLRKFYSRTVQALRRLLSRSKGEK